MRYLTKLVLETAARTAVGIVVALLLAMAGVGAVKHSPQAAFEVPQALYDGVTQMTRAATKYLEQP